MAALLLERIMANFIGTSVWLFEKKKTWHEVNFYSFFFFFFSEWLFKILLL